MSGSLLWALQTKRQTRVEEAQVSAPRELVEKAQKAATYTGNAELSNVLAAVLSTQGSGLLNIEVTASLEAQMKTAIGLARNRQQTEFAVEILPMARQLLENATRAGLTQSRHTENGKVTAFDGQNYSVRCRESEGKQELKVLCHRTDGLIYAVDGKPQKSQGLLKGDKATFARFASMTPIQLRDAIRGRQAAVKADLGL
jgi:hypothetical protein